MAIVFEDQFIEASDTPLVSHSPETGTGWSIIYDDTASSAEPQVKVTGDSGASEVAGPSINENSVGVMAAVSPAPTDAEITIETSRYMDNWEVSNTYACGIFGRHVEIAGSHTYYALYFVPNLHGSDTIRLYKVINNSGTLLGSYDHTFSNGDVIELEITDASKRVLVNGVERINSADNAISGVGNAGIWWGNVPGLSTGHIRDQLEYGYFIITSEAAVTDVDLLGQADGSSTATGALTVDEPPGDVLLTGTADGTSTASGALTVDDPAYVDLAGTASCTSTSTGVLTVDEPVITDVFLTGQSDGTSTGSGSLHVQLPVAAKPSYTLEIDNSYGGDTDWYPLTADVLEVQVDHGFSGNEFVADVGVMTFVLRNDTQRFSPRNGFYSGTLKPGTEVKLGVEGIGTIFQGYITEITPAPGRFGQQTVLVICEDRLGILARKEVNLPNLGGFGIGTIARTVAATAFETGQARAWVEFASAPTPGSAIRVGEELYTFVAGTPAAAGQVKLGATLGETVRNLASAINTDAAYQSGYHSLQKRNRYVSAHYTPRTSLGNQVFTHSPTWEGELAEVATGWVEVDHDLIIGTGDVYARYFTSNVYGQLNQISLYLMFQSGIAAPGSETCQPIAELWTDADGEPGRLVTRLLTPQTTPALQGSQTYGNWFDFLPEETTFLKPGLRYWVVLVPQRYERDATAISNGIYHQGQHITEWAGLAPYSVTTLKRDADTLLWEAAPSPLDGGALSIFVNITELPRYMIELYAQAHGGWGNLLLFSSTHAGLYLTGFYGGAYPDWLTSDNVVGVLDSFTPYSSDANAMSIVRGLAQSEYGQFYSRGDGTYHFRGRRFFSTAAISSSVDLSDLVNLNVDYSQDRVTNRVVVEYIPAKTKSFGVLAESPQVISVPGTGLPSTYQEEKWNIQRVDDPNNPSNVRTVNLKYTEPVSGAQLAAESIQTPVPGVDFTVTDSPEPGGYDYTGSPYLHVSIAPSTAGVKVTFTNTALGTLYVYNFQIRGVGLLHFVPVQVIRESGQSQRLYGINEKRFAMPYQDWGGPELVATSIAELILSRESVPAPQFTGAGRYASHPSAYDIRVGDIATLEESHLNLDERVMIEGISFSIQPNEESAAFPLISYRLRQLGNRTYWILNSTGFSELGSTTRLGI